MRQHWPGFSLAEFPRFVGIGREQRPALRKHEAQPRARHLRSDHGGDDQRGVEGCVDDACIVGHARQDDAWASARVCGYRDVDDIKPAKPAEPRRQSC